MLLGQLAGERDPQAYDLCTPHADKTAPPRGWQLQDERPTGDDADAAMDSDETVAVLRAALRGSTGAPEPPPDDGSDDEPTVADDATAVAQPAEAEQAASSAGEDEADVPSTGAAAANGSGAAARPVLAARRSEAGAARTEAGAPREDAGDAGTTSQMTIDEALATGEPATDAPDELSSAERREQPPSAARTW